MENSEKEPFKYKYEAREIFEGLIKTINTRFAKEMAAKHQLLTQAAAVC